jgi:hypothetical protein
MAEVVAFPTPVADIVFIEAAGQRFRNRLLLQPGTLPDVEQDWPSFDLAIRHAMHCAAERGFVVAFKPTREDAR